MLRRLAFLFCEGIYFIGMIGFSIVFVLALLPSLIWDRLKAYAYGEKE